MSKEQTPIEMAIEAMERELQACIDRLHHAVAASLREDLRTRIDNIREALAAIRAMPTAEIAEPVPNPDKRVAGVFKKYNVTRTDGKPVAWCFVLEDRDPVTPKALRFLAPKYMALGYDNLADDLLSMADKIEGRYPPKPDQPRVVLTNEDVERMVLLADSDAFIREDGVLMMSAFGNGYHAGLRYARDNGYLAPAKPLPVDDMMEDVEEYIAEQADNAYSGLSYDRTHPRWMAMMDDLRARLTAKFGQQ